MDENEKERILKLSMINTYLRTGSPELDLHEYEMTALAKPLIYNSEFQGIVYVARMFGDKGFDENDHLKFKNLIDVLQAREALYDSGFAHQCARYRSHVRSKRLT